MLNLYLPDPRIDLEAEFQADNSFMSTAKKIDEKELASQEDMKNLPPVPNISLLNLVATEPTSNLPPAPNVRLSKKSSKVSKNNLTKRPNVFLILGMLSLLFMVVSCVTAAILYLVATGVIDVSPSEIKQFLKAISFR